MFKNGFFFLLFSCLLVLLALNVKDLNYRLAYNIFFYSALILTLTSVQDNKFIYLLRVFYSILLNIVKISVQYHPVVYMNFQLSVSFVKKKLFAEKLNYETIFATF